MIPNSQDLSKSIIEARAIARQEGEEESSDFVNLLATSGPYGLFVQVAPAQVRKGEREVINLFSGETQFILRLKLSKKKVPSIFRFSAH